MPKDYNDKVPIYNDVINSICHKFYYYSPNDVFNELITYKNLFKYLIEMDLKEITNLLLQTKEELTTIENFDVTEMIHLQMDYPKVLPSILKLIKLFYLFF